MIFVVGILFLLWLFQVVLLQPIYEMNKINAVKSVASEISNNIDNPQLEEYMISQSKKNDLCIRIIHKSDIITAPNYGCMISTLPIDQLYGYYTKAIENGGTFLSVNDMIEMSFSLTNPDRVVPKTNGDKNIVYTKVIDDENGESIILVNTQITRVNAATKTLTNQLFYLGIIIILATFILVFLLTKKIVKPIEKINNAAKSLYNGNYNSDGFNHGYREIGELNKTLSNACDQIKKADKAKRDLIANVSHDLRTPLTMITGYGEMMKDLPNEKTDENLQVIIDESKRLSLLVNDLLDLSRLSEHAMTLNLETFSITSLCKEIIGSYEAYLKKENFVIKFENEGDYSIVGDRKRIAQVLHNFINNAINYSADSKEIVINQIVLHDKITIEIQDFGIGLDENTLPLVWERYYKVDKEHVRYLQGSGIGLAIVKEILDLHQYEYGVKSQINKGSTFYFETVVAKKEN